MPELPLSHTSVLRCIACDCGLQFAWPQLDDRDIGEAYRRLYYPKDGTRPAFPETSAQVQEQFFSLAEAAIGGLRGKRLLDFGCGMGTLMQIAAARGLIGTGIEPDPVAREEVQKNQSCEVYENIEALLAARSDARFDLVVLWNVVEHLRHPWIELGKLRDLLVPEGILWVWTPNAGGLKSSMLRSRWDQRTNPTHFYYFTAKSLRALLRKAGFSDFQECRFALAYPNHSAVRRLIQRALVAAGLHGELVFLARASKSS